MRSNRGFPALPTHTPSPLARENLRGRLQAKNAIPTDLHVPAPRQLSLLPQGPASRPRGSARCSDTARGSPSPCTAAAGTPIFLFPPSLPPPPPRRLLPPDPSCKQHPGSIYSRRRTARDPRQHHRRRRGWGKSECATFIHTPRPAPPRRSPSGGPERGAEGPPAPSSILRSA